MSRYNLRKTRNLIVYFVSKQWKLLFVFTSLLVLVNLSSLSVPLTGTYNKGTMIIFYEVTIILSSLLAMILPFIVLSYLNDASQLDFFSNAPLKSNEVFNTSLVSGLIILIIVYILGFLSNLFISVSFLDYSHYHIMTFITGLIIIIFLYFVTSTSFLLTTTALDASIIVFVSFFLLVLGYFIFELISNHITNRVFFDNYEIISYLSILFGATRLTSFAIEYLEQGHFDFLPFIILTAYYLIISGGLYFSNRLLLKNRKNENVTTVLNNTKIYQNIIFVTILLTQIMSTIPLVSTRFFFLMYYVTALFPFLLSTLLYAAFMVFSERSFKEFKKHLKYYGLIGIITHIILLIIYGIF